MRRPAAVFAVAIAAACLLAACTPGGGLPPKRPATEPVTPPPSASTTPAPGAVPTLPPSAEETRQTPPPPSEGESPALVVIDAGHQAKGNPDPEPVGPDASQTKPKVSSGTRGVVTRIPESEITLQVALLLEEELSRRGVEVLQVRTTQDVDISNAERSAIANEAGADLFVRLHADGGPRSRRGISTLVPGANRWTNPIVNESARAGHLVHRSVLDATGAEDGGVRERTDLTGFNWSEVPTVLVEMGFMTNPDEDRLLASPSYQRKLAEGIANGVVEYLGGD